MRYKLLLCVFLLLIATPVLVQELSPIVVETGKPIPSVVRSGEPFKITYRAKFLDTVVVSEEQMHPDNLALGKIEVIGLAIVKERMSNDALGFINVWDFTYVFRIIQPEKGGYKVPSFNFIWVEKRAGVTIEETRNKEKPREFPTEEVGIGYVSSVVKPPLLDIRDEINFVSHVFSPFAFRLAAYIAIGIASLLLIVIVFKFTQDYKIRQTQDTNWEESDPEIVEYGVISNIEPVLTPRQARKKFLKELKKLRGEAQNPTLDLEKKIRLSVRWLLLAELRGTIRASMSENEIYAKLSKLDIKQKKKMKSKYEYVVNLAQILRGYREKIDSGTCLPDLRIEINDLEVLVSGLKFYKRVLSFVKRLVRARQ